MLIIMLIYGHIRKYKEKIAWALILKWNVTYFPTFMPNVPLIFAKIPKWPYLAIMLIYANYYANLWLYEAKIAWAPILKWNVTYFPTFMPNLTLLSQIPHHIPISARLVAAGVL